MPTGTNVMRFTLGGLRFEYDPEKNRKNIEKHGISFQSAARVFFDYDRIELYDEGHSETEDRYNTLCGKSDHDWDSAGPPANR